MDVALCTLTDTNMSPQNQQSGEKCGRHLMKTNTYDEFSSNKMGFKFVTIWYILEGNTVTPHQSLKQWCYDDLKNANPLIRIYHEKS